MNEKEHKKATLMGWKKEKLVEHCMCLERNYNIVLHRDLNSYTNFLAVMTPLIRQNEALKTKLDMLNKKLEAYKGICNKGFPHNMLLALAGERPAQDMFLELDVIVKELEQILKGEVE